MSLFTRLKADALAARKMRATLAAASLTTLIGELQTFAKNSGREPTDADVNAFIQKTLKGVNEVLRLAPETSEAYGTAFREKELLEGYLPKQLSADELSAVIDRLVAEGASSVGDVMKLLKTKYNGQYDGATASALLKARFAK